jgi:salicylate hydroxylase
MISANATRILCDMGLRETLDACGIHMKKVVFKKFDDGSILDERVYQDEQETEAQLGGPNWQIHRADLHDVLLKKAIESGVKITMGAKVKSYDWDAPNALLEDGSTIKADVILAADG